MKDEIVPNCRAFVLYTPTKNYIITYNIIQNIYARIDKIMSQIICA